MSGKKKIRLALLISLLGLTGSFSWAVTIDGFSMPSARNSAMGGTHAALADDFSSLFSNPAGFVGVDGEVSVSELSLSLYGPLFDIFGVVSNFMGDGGSLDLSGIDSNGFIAGMNLGGPLSYGWVGKGLGFGFFNNSHLLLDVSGVTVDASMAEDIFVEGGYAFRLAPADGHILDIGFLGKGFVRGAVALSSSVLTADQLFTGDIIGDNPYTSTVGVGLDVGLRYDYIKTLAVGLVCHDIYSPALVTEYASAKDFFSGADPLGSSTYATIHPDLDVGLLYHPRSFFLDRYTSKVLVMLDYKDFLDLFETVPRNPILNVSLGTEVVILEALSLRAGISDALPNFGLGLDLTFMRLDISMYGMELGLDPGVRSVFGMDIGFLFRY